ncbi:hypothetical protein [Pseudaestuariivita rosea]|uniref:hypothetical protein n=1 Tax=Pseudaestuariivita rosea TaxID=2763263 RepID=UPI001ABAB63E|nr:hypothetical protein [Pseudaestuariivita rosea]
MHALILDSRFSTVGKIGAAVKARGITTKQKLTVEGALGFLRTAPVDLLIIRECIGDAHSLSVALAAEYYNPNVATVILSDRKGDDADELFDLLPSLYSLMGNASTPESIAAIADAACEMNRDTPLILGKQFRVYEDEVAMPKVARVSPFFSSARVAQPLQVGLSA